MYKIAEIPLGEPWMANMILPVGWYYLVQLTNTHIVSMKSVAQYPAQKYV